MAIPKRAFSVSGGPLRNPCSFSIPFRWQGKESTACNQWSQSSLFFLTAKTNYNTVTNKYISLSIRPPLIPLQSFLFYLGDREDVHPAYFFLQPAHQHGSTNQQEVRHTVSVHVQGAQHTPKVRPNLGERVANDGEINWTPHVSEWSVFGEESRHGYLFPSFRVDDRQLFPGIHSVDYNLSRVVGARCACHKVFSGPIAHRGDRIAWNREHRI